MSIGHTYKFFGFYISYTILTLPLFSTYHLCYLFSVPFPPLFPSHSPYDNPPCDLHFCDSVPILVVCLVCFCFLDLVDSYEFVVFFFKILFIIREGKGERKKHQCVVASQAPPPLRAWPATQARTLTGNRTSDPPDLQASAQPLSHTSQGKITFKIKV